MKKDKSNIKGYALMEMMAAKAAELGWNLQDLANYLCVSYAYISALSSGERKTCGLKEEKKRRVAELLGIPVFQVYVLSGELTPDDMLPPAKAELPAHPVPMLKKQEKDEE